MTNSGLSEYRGYSMEVICNIFDQDCDFGDKKTWQEERGEDRYQQYVKMFEKASNCWGLRLEKSICTKQPACTHFKIPG